MRRKESVYRLVMTFISVKNVMNKNEISNKVLDGEMVDKSIENIKEKVKKKEIEKVTARFTTKVDGKIIRA